MHTSCVDQHQKVCQQYDFSPYPHWGNSNADYHPDFLFLHSLVTVHYLRHRRVTTTDDKLILDAGCGSGYKAFALATANPGAKIVGIDFSSASVQFARERFAAKGINAQFEVLKLEDIASLGLQFDYINCDEILYMLPDPLLALKALRSVLKPDGLLRGNFHSLWQRSGYLRAQKVFGLLGLMDRNPETKEIQLAQHFLSSLRNETELKQRIWPPGSQKDATDPVEAENILMNLLIQNDKGYTIPDVFAMLRAADLEFISMTNWAKWNLADLMQHPDQSLAIYGINAQRHSPESLLHLFELLHPTHRLLDFWCGCPSVESKQPDTTDWLLHPPPIADWDAVQVHLHPQLCIPLVKEKFQASLAQRKPLNLAKYLSLPAHAPVRIDGQAIATLLPLHDAPQPFMTLLDRWLKLSPLNPVTLEPYSREAAATELQQLLLRLEACLYILLQTN
jgi:2-polyprenyl-3-methyl-5-hydroxy-6-metoxy-1,4-benzoquinol methylase